MIVRCESNRSMGRLEPGHLPYHHGTDWKMYPDLELWIEADGDLTLVTAEGTLDDRTGPCLVEAIGRLAGEGHRRIRLDAHNLEINLGNDVMFRRVNQSLAALGVEVAWSLSPAPPG